MFWSCWARSVTLPNRMIIDLIVVFALLIGTVRGYYRGLASKLIGLAGLITSYVAALVLYRPLGDLLVETYRVPSLLAYGGSGMTVFMIVSALFSIADGVRHRIMKKKMITLTRMDRVLGAALGFLVNATYAFVAVFLVSCFPADSGVARFLAPGDSVAVNLARPLTEAAAAMLSEMVTGDDGIGRMVTRAASDPEAVSERVRDLMTVPDFHALLADDDLMQRVGSGDLDSALEDSRVGVFLQNPAVQDFMLEFADESETGAEADVQQKRMLLQMMARVSRLKSQPWMQAISGDPEIQDMLKKGDVLGLMQNEKLGNILTRPDEDSRQ